MRILIAEDDFTSRAILTAALKKHGHETVTTVNGAEAWEAMQQPDAPQLAILDWMMPHMDGVEVCRRVRALETDQPPYIILLTSRDEKADIIAGLEAGADDYVAKPYDPRELHARINVGLRMIEMQAKLLEARNALAYQATHDPLTGAKTRRAILEALSRELARERREHNGLAVGICDIDHFKKINDMHGHLVGDETLCGVVRLLESSLRQYDFLGRFGGEEFVVITPGVKENGVGSLYERLRTVVANNPIPTKAGNVSVTVSIGVAVLSGEEMADNLFAAADAALYQAKSEGRNRVCLAGGRCGGEAREMPQESNRC
jgi:diguanylate cyclase (GGDEF)-like protein